MVQICLSAICCTCYSLSCVLRDNVDQDRYLTLLNDDRRLVVLVNLNIAIF